MTKSKMLRRFLSIILVAVAVASLFPNAVGAAESLSVMPRWNNGAQVTNEFYIDSYGMATVVSRVIGTSGVTTGITIEIQLQRKGLLWWSDVDGGYWSDTYIGHYGTTSGGIELEETGKYRAVITVTVSGTGGADDVIEETLTYEY